jgi:hypothetical protein
MTTCTRHQAVIDDVGDLDRLPVETSRHVDACAECARFGRELVELRLLLREPDRISPPPDFDARLAARLQRVKVASGPWAWTIAHQRHLAAAACIVVAVTTAVTFRTNPGAVSSVASPEVAVASVAPREPDALEPQVPAFEQPVLDEKSQSVSHPELVARRETPHRVARASTPRTAPPSEEIRIFVQDAQGARIVSFEPVIYGAQTILPDMVAAGRSEGAQIASSF